MLDENVFQVVDGKIQVRTCPQLRSHYNYLCQKGRLISRGAVNNTVAKKYKKKQDEAKATNSEEKEIDLTVPTNDNSEEEQPLKRKTKKRKESESNLLLDEVLDQQSKKQKVVVFPHSKRKAKILLGKRKTCRGSYYAARAICQRKRPISTA